MANSVNDYLKLLQHLLPAGKLWNRLQDSGLGEFFHGAAEELARIDLRGDDLFLEASSKTTTELIEEYEEEYAIPESGSELQSTLAGRRSEINTKILGMGRQDKDYFIELAAALGYTVTIEEYTPAWCGLMQAGDPCGDQVNIFYWTVYVEIENEFLPDLIILQNKINTFKPAHTVALFNYSGPAYSRGFNRGFNSIPSFDGTFYPGGFDPGFSNGFKNNIYYDGTYLIGGFNSGFRLGFNAYNGGAFFKDGFSSAFRRPA